MVCLLSAMMLTGCGNGTIGGREDSEETTRTAEPDWSEALRSSDLTEIAGDLSETALSEAAQSAVVSTNVFASLSVPTDFLKSGEYWFLVDCYHNQIIYSEELGAPLYEWKVLADGLSYPHTISTDGTVFLITDTDADRIVIVQEVDGVFLQTQTFDGIGSRPHYSVYREEEDTFYVWSSMSGEMYLFRRDSSDSRIYLMEVRTVPALSDRYIRAFTIEGDSIYFVAGLTTDGSGESAFILQCSLADFETEAEYAVPDEIAGMACMRMIDGKWYITVSTDLSGSQDAATILCTEDLESLERGEWEDLYEQWFVGGGTPYSIIDIGDDWYLTEHRLNDHALWRFHVEEGEIVNVESVY